MNSLSVWCLFSEGAKAVYKSAKLKKTKNGKNKLTK